MNPPVSPIEILGKLKEVTFDPVALNAEVEKIPETERTAVFEGVAQEIAKLDPEIKKIVDANQRALEARAATGLTSTALRSLLDTIQAPVVPLTPPVAVDVIAPDAMPVATNKPEQEKSVLTQIGDGLATVSDTVLPTEWTTHMSRESKIAFASLGVPLAAYLLLKLGKLLFRGGKATVDATKNAAKNGLGFFGKLLIGSVVATGAYAVLQKLNIVPNLLGSVVDGAKEKGAALLHSAQGALGLDVEAREAQKYGLTSDQFKTAEKMYLGSKPLNEIKTVFGLPAADTSTSPAWELFLAKMKSVHTAEKDPANGIEYNSIAASMRSYEAVAEDVCIQVSRWLDNHKDLAAVTAIGLSRYGILQGIFKGTGSGLFRLGSAGTSLASWGLKEHKLVGLFTLCGLLAAPTLIEASSHDIRMPKNLSALLKACSMNVPTIKGTALGADLSAISTEISRYGAVVGEIAGDVTEWASNEAFDLLSASVDLLLLSDEEVIINNHINTFDALRSELASSEAKVRQRGDIEADRQESTQWQNAQKALGAYRDLFLEHHKKNIQDPSALSFALKELQNTLNPLGVIVTKRSDRLVWFTKNEPDIIKDFGVDPLETNPATILQVSQSLDAGEFLTTRFVQAAFQRFRMEMQDNREMFPAMNRWLAIPLGNLVYVLDPGNLVQYYVVPFEHFVSIYKGDESFGDFSALVGDELMQTVLLTVSPTIGLRLLSKVVGVAPLHTLKVQGLRNFVPLMRELDLYYALEQLSGGVINMLENGIFRGRRMNTLLTDKKLHFEKKWFRAIMDPKTTLTELYKIAGEAGLNLDDLKAKGATIKEVRDGLRTGMITKINEVERGSLLRAINPRNWFPGGAKIVQRIQGGNIIFDDLATSRTSFEVLKSALLNTNKAFTAFMNQLNALRTSVNATGAQIQAFLLSNYALLKAAAATNPYAAKLLKLCEWLRIGGRGAARALPVLTIVLDSIFIGMNELEISEAVKAGNTQKADILRLKRIPLGISGASGIAMLSMNPIIMAPAAVFIGASMYSNAIYDSIVTWENRRTDWLTYPPEYLAERLRERGINYTDIGLRTGAGHTMAWGGYRRLRSWFKSGAEANDQEDESEFEAIEGVNEHVRQELLAAYFIKKLQVPSYASDTPEITQKRMTTTVQDCLNYVRSVTSGTYAIDEMLGLDSVVQDAESYAKLIQMRRAADEQGTERHLQYVYDGKEKVLDLTTLDYVTGADLSRSLDFRRTLRQYQKEVAVVQTAMQEIEAMDISQLAA